MNNPNNTENDIVTGSNIPSSLQTQSEFNERNMVNDANSPVANQTVRRGLGRGLGAILGDELETPSQIGQASLGAGPIMADIDQVRPNPDQPRRQFHDDSLEALANSIKLKGIIQPIIVRILANDTNHRYEIIAGERRWRAAQRAQIHQIPIQIRESDGADILELALIENLHREDLGPLDEAEAYQQLIERHHYTQEKAAEAVGKSRSHVANMLRLLNLPETIQRLLNEGKLTIGHARALLNAEDAIDLAKKIIAEGLSVRQAEKLAQNSKNRKIDPLKEDRQTINQAIKELNKTPTIAPTSLEISNDPNIIAITKDLSSALGLVVQIQTDGSGKSGRMIIHYNDVLQLDDLIIRLTQSESIA